MDIELIKKINEECLKKPVEEKTILFIEAFHYGARGVITQKFEEILSDPSYKDHKLVWIARDRSYAVEKYGHSESADRICIHTVDDEEYIRYLSLSKTIYTAEYMPSFFIKRDDQVLYYAPPDHLLVRKRYDRKMMWKMLPVVNNADRIIIKEKTAGADRFMDISGRRDSTDIIKDKRSKYRNYKGKTVFVSLLDNDRGADGPEVFRYIYHTLRSLSEAYGYNIYWKIPVLLYKTLKKDGSLDKEFLNVQSSEQECSSLMHRSDIIIADNIYDMVSACKEDGEVLYYHGPEAGEECVGIDKKVLSTSDFEQLVSLFEEKVCGGSNVSDIPSVPLLFDCPIFLKGLEKADDFSSESYVAAGASDKSGKKPEVLIVTEMFGYKDFVKDLHQMLTGYKDKMRITVLYRSSWNEVLYKKIPEISTDIIYICRSGSIRCSGEDRRRLTHVLLRHTQTPKEKKRFKAIMHNEWKRMLGGKQFDHAIVIKGKNIFWANMYDHIPADRTDEFTTQETSGKTVEKIQDLLNASF